MKYYLVAGEASGDMHGANLMKALKALDPAAEFRFFGGDLMLAEGGNQIKHYREMAYMGLVEVIVNLPAILKNIKQCKQDIHDWQPDVLILIDIPGFNLKIAAYAQTIGLKVNYYISPKVWAWNQKRVLKIKKIVNHLFCILPFEVDFYKSWGMEVDYVGNPLLDAIAAFKSDPDFLQQHQLTGKKIIALLPGSRKQEISNLLPEMLDIVERFPNHQLVIAGAPSFSIDYYKQFLGDKNIPVLFDATYNLLSHAEAAVVASGTATLETALFHVPQVVVYKGNALTIAVARMLVKLEFISLVNLIMNKGVVKELIQENCTVSKISDEVYLLVNNKDHRQKVLSDYDELDKRMGQPGASEKTAALIIRYAQNK
ncbi:lipid-A-disaccharide synthase [Mucilaginibacter lappiensis]|uniref:Lipid-A-disaccharide synthase n=1 Tax=Mucilaginibacter lappiensis TaxID=354630 RepID=A0ABR6PTA5_9SPHI|nr:lipid-A-disaccharide synthase [Mucilaginibacter lappiensis]MBB6111511.1 lipid-A-disaccharide synthase [Mucilaginibacter lappiensis]SIR80522.1 lipid-A-disaccharide synthase [Mucilaginibacter lappiensis]